MSVTTLGAGAGGGGAGVNSKMSRGDLCKGHLSHHMRHRHDLLPECRPAAPAFSAGCSLVPGAPLRSGHWELQERREMLLGKLYLTKNKQTPRPQKDKDTTEETRGRFGNGDSCGSHSPSASPKEDSTLLAEKKLAGERLPWKRERKGRLRSDEVGRG